MRSSIQSAKIRPGADCGSDHELLIAKFRLKLNKVGKTTRPFRYDLNQILYDYTVEVTKRYIRYIDIFDISLAIANISKDIKISRILKSASFAYHGK